MCKRTFKERWRDYFDQIRLIQALGVAVLLGLLWWKSNIKTEAQLRDQVIRTHLNFPIFPRYVFCNCPKYLKTTLFTLNCRLVYCSTFAFSGLLRRYLEQYTYFRLRRYTWWKKGRRTCTDWVCTMLAALYVTWLLMFYIPCVSCVFCISCLDSRGQWNVSSWHWLQYYWSPLPVK